MNNTLLLSGPDLSLYLQGILWKISGGNKHWYLSPDDLKFSRNIMLWMARWMLQEKDSHFVCSCLLLWVSLCPSGGWCWCWLLTDCPWLRNTEPLTSLVPGDHTLHPPELTTLSWLPAASPGHCCKDVKSDPPTPPSCLDSHPHGCQLISCPIFNGQQSQIGITGVVVAFSLFFRAAIVYTIE